MKNIFFNTNIFIRGIQRRISIGTWVQKDIYKYSQYIATGMLKDEVILLVFCSEAALILLDRV